MNLADIERRLRALERQQLRGPGVSTAYGGEVRPTQVGLPVELTGGYDAATGYPWKQLVLNTTTPDVRLPAAPRTGDLAFSADNDQLFTQGRRGWLEADPGAGGWLFTPVHTRGRCFHQGLFGIQLTTDDTWTTIACLSIPVAGWYQVGYSLQVSTEISSVTDSGTDHFAITADRTVYARLYVTSDTFAGVLDGSVVPLLEVERLNYPYKRVFHNVVTLPRLFQQTAPPYSLALQVSRTALGGTEVPADATWEITNVGDVGGNAHKAEFWYLRAEYARDPDCTGCSPGSGGSGSGGGTDCCDPPPAGNLVCDITVNAGSNCLGIVNGQTFERTGPEAGTWIGTGLNETVQLECIDGVYTLLDSAGVITTQTVVSVDCETFAVVIDVEGECESVPFELTLSFSEAP